MPPRPLPDGITPDRLLVTTDLDEMPLSSSGRIGERTRNALRRARVLGAVVVMATSRPLHDTEKLVGPIADFLICSGGAVTVGTVVPAPPTARCSDTTEPRHYARPCGPPSRVYAWA